MNPFADEPLYAPTDTRPVLIEINAQMVPLVLRALDKYKYRSKWVSDADYETGLQQIIMLQEALLSSSAADIVTSIDRLYRLMDTSLNGTAYSLNGGLVEPAIPAAPDNAVGDAPGLRRQLLDLQGTLPAGWFGWGSQNATLADVVRAMRADTEAQVDRVKSSFNALQTLAQGATVFDVVSGFLEEGAQVTAEGGILATLIVSTMAQSAMMGAQAGQLDQLLAKLDRLITAMDGGQTPAPATNVIAELQAANEKLV